MSIIWFRPQSHPGPQSSVHVHDLIPTAVASRSPIVGWEIQPLPPTPSVPLKVSPENVSMRGARFSNDSLNRTGGSRQQRFQMERKIDEKYFCLYACVSRSMTRALVVVYTCFWACNKCIRTSYVGLSRTTHMSHGRVPEPDQSSNPFFIGQSLQS
jgi:hypothetical protein